MPNIEFSINLPSSDPLKLMEIASDYDNLSKIVTGNMKCVVLEQKEDEILTEEMITTSKINLKISQKSIHKKILPNKLETKIISGPMKGSLISTKFENINSKTKVTLSGDLKLSLKYKILYFFIIKKYKMLLTKLFRRMNELAIITQGKSWKDALNNPWEGEVISENTSVSIKIHGWLSGDIVGIFINKEYDFLPVLGKTVIDVGANIADSAIYFAARGATKVIALEPYPKNYELAKKNIEENNLSDRITLLLAACSDKNDNITVDSETIGGDHEIIHSEKGTKILTMTLKNILDTYDINSAILKIDCEGCEYDVILSSSINVLKKFSHIQIEYHDGYHVLEKKLTDANFQVSHSLSPMFGKNVGMIQASQN